MSDVMLDTAAERAEVSESRRRLGADALLSLAFRIGGMPFAFVVSVILSRSLLPTGRGAYVLALLTVTLAATLLGNVGTAATHELSRKEHDPGSVVSQSLSIALMLGVIGAVVIYPVSALSVDARFANVAYVALGLPAVLVAQTLSSALIGLGRILFASCLQLLLPVATLAAMLGFVIGLRRGTTGAVAAWVCAQSFTAVVAMFGTRRLWWPLRLEAIPRARVMSMGLLGLRIGLVNAISLLNYRVELIILEASRGLAEVGLYSLATSLAELLWVLSTAVATAAIPAMVAARSDKEAAEIAARSARVALTTTAICGIALAIGGWFLIGRLFGVNFVSSRESLAVLIPGIVAFAPGSVVAAFFTLRQGKMRYPLRFSLLSLIVTALFALVFVPAYAQVGAAIASSIGYTVAMVAATVFLCRVGDLPLSRLVPSTSDVRALRTLTGDVLKHAAVRERTVV